MFQRLKLHASNVRGTSFTPGRGIKIPHVAQCGQENTFKIIEIE